MSPQAALQRAIEHREIDHDDMVALMRQIMTGEVSPVMIAALLSALRVKKESIGEISAAASVMRELSTKVSVGNPQQLVDTCGTGGDGAHTFNISTAAMFVAAAAGAAVAKHGGRASSSQSGSADVLEALGANLNLNPTQIGDSINAVGVGFMFAPNHHSAMKYAAPVRKELGVRTLFNILGPLTNPAGAANQLMGVFHPDLVGIQVRVLQRLGSQRVMIVHGDDGLDELSISAPTLVGELRDGEVREYRINPSDVGLATHDLSSLQVDSVDGSRALLRAALTGQHPAARDIVAFNAGASIYLSGASQTLKQGVEHALDAIADGRAHAKLEQFIAYTQKVSN